MPIEIDPDAISAAHAASAGLVKRTPLLTAGSLTERCGGEILLKAESLQRTGSFKLRGALAKIRAVGDEVRGVVAASAGNHGQSLAYAARASGVACEVFMPGDAAISKINAVRDFGAVVHDGGPTVDECIAAARAHAAAHGTTFVHPFDDPDVITGQAGVGLELLEQADDLARVVVPLGGGGLISGLAIAVKQQRPDVRVVGVQASACAPYLDGGAPAAGAGATIADGIAVKQPGQVTRPLVEHWVDDVVGVDEDTIAEAMVMVVERSKLVVEGAGAVAVAALISGAVAPAPDGQTVAVLSGGNVDLAVLGALAARHETTAGRRSRIYTTVPDRPGGLAELLGAIAELGVNVITVEHVRDGVTLDVRQTGVEVALETRGAGHLREALDALGEAGYEVSEIH